MDAAVDSHKGCVDSNIDARWHARAHTTVRVVLRFIVSIKSCHIRSFNLDPNAKVDLEEFCRGLVLSAQLPGVTSLQDRPLRGANKGGP